MADNTFREKMEEYLQLYEEIRRRTGDDRSALVILQEVNKDLRMAQIREERESSSGKGNGNGNRKEWPATAKQIEYLQRLDVPIPAGLTKKQASRLLDEAKARESEEDCFQAGQPLPDPHSILIPWYCAYDE